MVTYNKHKVMYDLSKFITEGGGGGGTSDHSKLENRSAANQHPISAISNLQETLAGKQPTGDYATNTRVNEVEGKIPSLIGYATESYVQGYHDNTKQDIITDLADIRAGAQLGSTALQSFTETDPIYTADKPNIALKSEIPSIPQNVSYFNNDSGYLVQASLDDYAKKIDIPDVSNFATKSEIPDISKLATDSAVVHKTGNETIGGVKTFNGGSGGNSVGIISLTGMLIGSVSSTTYTQYGTIRKCNNKAHTGSYYMYSDGSLFFRHKTGTATAEGTVNDATLFLHPVNGLQAAWSGKEGVDAGTPHDVLVDTIQYSKLNTAAKDIIGAINEVNTKGGGGGINLDNVTISKNTNEELQAIALIDNNNNAIKTWTGTKAEYEAITVKDNNTLYNITDDSDINITLLELLFPVGAIYQGTMGVCPLQVLMPNTQWELTAQGRVLQGADENHVVGEEIDPKLPNLYGVIRGGDTTASGSTSASGVFVKSTAGSKHYATSSSGSQVIAHVFDASSYNSIYSEDCNTVQPPAKVVNIWERVA